MSMVKCSFELKGKSPISFSRPFRDVKKTGESHKDFDDRIWPERCHFDNDDMVFHPGQAVKNCLVDCAIYLSESVPGKGNAKYRKHFEAGIMVVDNLPMGVRREDIESESVFVPPDGRRGGGSRVWKNFPIIRDWSTKGSLFILDPILIAHPEKVEEYLRYAGDFIGLGRWRPIRGGLYGRFDVVSFDAKEVS